VQRCVALRRAARLRLRSRLLRLLLMWCGHAQIFGYCRTTLIDQNWREFIYGVLTDGYTMVVVRVDRTAPPDVSSVRVSEQDHQFYYSAYDPVSLTEEAGIKQLIALFQSDWKSLVRWVQPLPCPRVIATVSYFAPIFEYFCRLRCVQGHFVEEFKFGDSTLSIERVLGWSERARVYAVSNVEADWQSANDDKSKLITADAEAISVAASAPSTATHTTISKPTCGHVCLDKAHCGHKWCCKGLRSPATNKRLAAATTALMASSPIVTVSVSVTSPSVSASVATVASTAAPGTSVRLDCVKCGAVYGSGGAASHRCLVNAISAGNDSANSADTKCAPAQVSITPPWPSVAKVFGEDYVDLFQTELQFASALRTAAVPGTLTLIDCDGGTGTGAVSRVVYYAERGQPLRARERLTRADFCQLIDTVKAMHKARWVHRDIRRSNMMHYHDRLYLIDYNFGVRLASPSPISHLPSPRSQASKRRHSHPTECRH
jgi:hypothetical protein